MTQPDLPPKQAGQPHRKAGKKPPRKPRKRRWRKFNPPPVVITMPEPEIYRYSMPVERWTVKVALLGKGPAVLFLPGFGMNWRWWLPAMRRVAKSRTAITFDMPGMGRAGPLGRPFPTPDEIRGAMIQIGHKLMLNDADAVGHGLGAYLILQHLMHGGGGIRRAMVVAPAGVEHHRPGIARTCRAALYHALALARPLKPVFQSVALCSYLAQGMPLSRELLARVRQDTGQWHNRHALTYMLMHAGKLTPLQNLVSPKAAAWLKDRVHIVWGENDRVFPLRHAGMLSRMLNGAPVSTYPGCGHWPHVTRREAFHAELFRWLDSPPPPHEPYRLFIPGKQQE